MFPPYILLYFQDTECPHQVYNMLILKEDLWRYTKKIYNYGSAIWLSFVPLPALAKFTLKCAMFISFKLQRTGFPASTTQSGPWRSSCLIHAVLHLCRMAPKIFPPPETDHLTINHLWDVPVHQDSRVLAMVLTGAKARLIESVSRFSLRYGKKINLIVTKLFGWVSVWKV